MTPLGLLWLEPPSRFDGSRCTPCHLVWKLCSNGLGTRVPMWLAPALRTISLSTGYLLVDGILQLGRKQTTVQILRQFGRNLAPAWINVTPFWLQLRNLGVGGVD